MKRSIFGHKGLPWLLLAPQLLVTIVFFLWPASQAFWQSFLREDPFGLKTTFIGLRNYQAMFADPGYLNSIEVTVVFAVSVTLVSMVAGLVLALAVSRVVRANTLYTTLLVWPYAVAPAVAGIMWWFIFNPTIGIMPYLLQAVGYDWNHGLHKSDAMILVVIAASWPRVSYNFLFFVAGMHAIPASLREAAAIDGAGPVKRFFTITLPLLSPTTFFLIVVNIVYTMFETFGVIHATTQGGPSEGTNIMVYKVYYDGILSQRLGASSTESVVLMAVVVALTVIQFRFVERRVNY